MSESENQESNHEDQAPEGMMGMSELEMLKNRARMMGIQFSNNIGVDTLKAKIQAKMDGTVDPDELEKTDVLEDGTIVNPLEQGAIGLDKEKEPEVPVHKLTLREYVYNENMALVRCRITNLDPKKKDLPGEIITVANEYLGTVRKFVPFGEHTEEGYHIPKCIFEFLKARRFLNIRTVKDRRTGTNQIRTTWAPEFALEVLDPLTDHELKQLAQAQIAAGSVPDANAA